MARKYVCDRFKLFRKLTSNYLTVYLFNSGDCLVVRMKELGGNCVAVVCIFILFFAIFKFYVHSAVTTYVIGKFFSSLYCNMAIITNVKF